MSGPHKLQFCSPTVVTTWDLSEAVDAQVWVCKFAHIHIYNINEITACATALHLHIVNNNILKRSFQISITRPKLFFYILLIWGYRC